MASSARRQRALVRPPGVGKRYLACALGHALVGTGISVLFTPTYQLVQQLLAARRDLTLPRALRALDAYDVMTLDDLATCSRPPTRPRSSALVNHATILEIDRGSIRAEEAKRRKGPPSRRQLSKRQLPHATTSR